MTEPFQVAPTPAQAIQAFNSKYPNRVCLVLSKDHYFEVSKPFLEQAAIRHARVPCKDRDEVYYFFFTALETLQFLNQLDVAGALK